MSWLKEMRSALGTSISCTSLEVVRRHLSGVAFNTFKVHNAVYPPSFAQFVPCPQNAHSFVCMKVAHDLIASGEV
jgi:hypothetical protein